MTITMKQPRHYLEANAVNTKYSIGIDIYFTYRLIQNNQYQEIPYTIHFSSPNWSKKTASYVGPENIRRYLDIFNLEKDPPASVYKNCDGQGSQSKNARYLRKLLKELAEQRS